MILAASTLGGLVLLAGAVRENREAAAIGLAAMLWGILFGAFDW